MSPLRDAMSLIDYQQRNYHFFYPSQKKFWGCLLYTSDAADDTPCVDLGGRRIIKKKI